MKTFNELVKDDAIYFMQIHPTAVNGKRFELWVDQIINVYPYDDCSMNSHRLVLASGYGIDITNTNKNASSIIFPSWNYIDHVIAIPFDVDCSETVLRRLGLKYIKEYIENQVKDVQGRIDRAKARYESSVARNTALIEQYKKQINDLSLPSDNLRKQIDKWNNSLYMKNRHV